MKRALSVRLERFLHDKETACGHSRATGTVGQRFIQLLEHTRSLKFLRLRLLIALRESSMRKLVPGD